MTMDIDHSSPLSEDYWQSFLNYVEENYFSHFDSSASIVDELVYPQKLEETLSNLRDLADIVDSAKEQVDVVLLSGYILLDAADEIEILRTALAIASGMLSTREPYTNFHPQDIFSMLVGEARRE